jgi:hypothetical protein
LHNAVDLGLSNSGRAVIFLLEKGYLDAVVVRVEVQD